MIKAIKETLKALVPDSPKKALLELTALAGLYGFLASPAVAENKPKGVVCKDGVCWIEKPSIVNKQSKSKKEKILRQEITIIKNDDFDEVLKSTMPVFVKAFAEWCMPCKDYHKNLFLPASKKYSSVKFYEMDAEKNLKISNKYGIKSYPTTMIFKNGRIIDAFVGATEFDEKIKIYSSSSMPSTKSEEAILDKISGRENLEKILKIINKYSFGKIDTIRGRFSYDLDTMNPVERMDEKEDILWSHETPTERYLIPTNAEIANLGIVDFEKIKLTDLQKAKYTREKIDGSDDNNQLINGTVLGIKTNKGNYLKLRIDGYLESPKAKIRNYDIKCTIVPYFEVEKSSK